MLRSAIKTLALAALAGALSFAAILYVILRASCTLVDCNASCRPGAVIESISSPNGQYVARIYNSFCGPPGGASNSYSVSLVGSTQQADASSLIFGQENSVPLVRWTAENRLIITPGGWDGLIWQSEHKVGGVLIDYTTDLAAMSADFVNEQKRISDNSEPDFAKRVNASSTRTFARFRSWAEGNTSSTLGQ